MKKLISLFLSAALLTAALAACGTDDTRQEISDSQSQTVSDSSSKSLETEKQSDSQAAENAEEPAGQEETESGTGNVLVVYYSASGNTRAVANVIAEHTGGDTFEIVPVNEYTDEDLNYTDDKSRVSLEHEDESLQDVELVSVTPENFDSYDTVFIGYPIWWHVAAWPVNNFVKNNDFSGKTVIPFCTSASSGLGDSGTILEEMAGTGDWQEGQRFSGHADQDEIVDWLEGLDF